MPRIQACPWLSRDTLLGYNRFRCELTRGIRDVINGLEIRRRGCRAGAHSRRHRAWPQDVNNNNNIAASRPADRLIHRIPVITSTRSRYQSSATLLMFAGRRDQRAPVRRPVEIASDIPVFITDRSSSHNATRASSTSSPPARRRSLVNIRCTRPPSVITVGQLNARSVGNKSVAINDLIVDHQLDLLAVVESWHDAASSPCLNAATPPGYTYVERARPRIGMHSKTNHGGTAISSDRTTPFVQ